MMHPPADIAARTRRLHTSLRGVHQTLHARDAEILAMQVKVSEIPAPTGDEHKRGTWVAKQLRAAGLSNVRVDEVGNVVGRRKGTRDIAPVVVCAHLDTVFPHGTSLKVTRDGARFAGPGIGDNGRGLAVMLALSSAVDGESLRTVRPIDFVATVCEEGAGDLRGAQHFFAAAGDVASVIALDGAGDERIVHRAVGSRRLRVSYVGPGGHSWAAFGVPNPVHAAGVAIARLAALRLPATPRTTLSVCRVGGGLSINAIPGDAWLEIDLRSLSSETIARLDRDIRAVAGHAAHEENVRRSNSAPELRLTIDVIGDRPCGDVAEDAPLVTAAIEATRAIGRDPELAAASTDANVPIHLGIPAIAIGAGGRGGDAHTVGEWFDNTEGTLGVARALTLLVAAAEPA